MGMNLEWILGKYTWYNQTYKIIDILKYEI